MGLAVLIWAVLGSARPSMALQSYSFSFVTPTPGSTGLHSLGESIPFDPLGFYFFSNGGVTSGTFFSSSTRRYHMHSFAVPPGTGSRKQGTGAVAVDQYNFGSISNGQNDAFGEFYSEEHSVAFIDNFGAFGTVRFPIAAHIDSVDDNGDGTFDLTFNYTTNEAANNFQHIIHAVAFGDDATDVTMTLFKWAADGTTASVAVTGVGFQSDVVWSIGNRQETGPTSTSAGGKTLMFAMNCGELQQVAAGTNMSNGSGQSVGVRVQEPAKAAVGLQDELLRWTMTLTSMDTDGWTLAPDPVSVGSFSAFACASFCFQGVSSHITAFNKPATTTGTQTVSTPSVNGCFALLWGTNNTSVTGLQNNDRWATGVIAQGGNNQAMAGSSSRTVDTPMSGVDRTDSCYLVVNNDSESVQARAISGALGSGDVSWNWTTNDSELTEILLMVLGTGGGGTCAGPSGCFAGTWVDTQMVPVYNT